MDDDVFAVTALTIFKLFFPLAHWPVRRASCKVIWVFCSGVGLFFFF